MEGRYVGGEGEVWRGWGGVGGEGGVKVGRRRCVGGEGRYEGGEGEV